MKRILFFLLLIPFFAGAQSVNRNNSAAIKLKLRKLNFLGSVLYVAAHPDDENTRIIASMANGELAATAYLSMTRGDGGQNLIGPEIRDLLGVIRTQELLAARRVDGGQQFFTRAVDFGYSKSADETFSVWGKDSILHDVIKVYRKFQPDVIITRFPPDERAGHGHHTASAMLAIEAFTKAADPKIFPKQLDALSVWQSKRLYTNTGRWWNSSITEDTPGVVAIDVGGFSPLLGGSYSEIAAVSRSQHKSQGFGSRGTRGRQLEFLEYQKGDSASRSVFEGINTTWSRIPNGAAIGKKVDEIIKSFDEERPYTITPALLEVRKMIKSLSPSVWRDRKLEEVEQLIQDCAGLYLEVTPDQYWVAPGEQVRLGFELLNRSPVKIQIDRISVNATKFDSTATIVLQENIPVLFQTNKIIAANASYSGPYWLQHPHETGLFNVPDRDLIGKAESDPAVMVTFEVTIGGTSLTIRKPLVYKWTDPVKGEQSRPFEIVPPVIVNVKQDVLVFPSRDPRQVTMVVKSASRNPVSGTLKLDLPGGWRTEPTSIPVNLRTTGEEQSYTFTVFPSEEEITADLKAVVQVGDKSHSKGVLVINYDHIPIQTLLHDATARIVRVNLNGVTGRIGYLKGAGDDVPAALRNMGFNVWEMSNEEVTYANLKDLKAVVLGIRAFNTNERLPFMMKDLLKYIEDGGTMVVQYNTAFGMQSELFSPFPVHISRDRVSEEDAEVSIINGDHIALNKPNKITSKDFENWVQERGLYFPDKWDPAFTPLLSMHDSKDEPKEGGLIVAPYGKGYYVYTGLSFFRQLPEGVPGAYKLFANLVSLANDSKPAEVSEPVSRKKKKH